MPNITIAGDEYTVPDRYAEGHTLNANEAAALNQTFHENLRNNFAGKVKSAKEAGAFDVAAFQEQLNAYAESYQFGVRTGGGGGSRDPVKTRSMEIARDMISKALVKKYGNLGKAKENGWTAKAISERAGQELPKHPEWTEMARQQVEQERAAAGEALDDLGLD